MLARRSSREAVHTRELLVMAVWAAVIGVGLVGLEVIVADTGWADPSGSPTTPAVTELPTSSSAGEGDPITTPSSGSPTASTVSPSETPSPSVSADPTPSTSPKGRSAERYGPAGDRAPVGGRHRPRVITPASTADASGAAAVPPPSPTPADQRDETTVQARYLSRTVAQGLIVGGAAGFMVSVIGMMLVGWIRRRV